MIHKVPRIRDMIVHSADTKQGIMCPEDIDTLRRWKLEFNGSSTNLLHAQGRQELHSIAARLVKRFPSLFMQPYSSSFYRIRTTQSPRTEESAKAFANGLFSTDKGVHYDIVDNDELLRFYKTCGRWEKEVDDNDSALREFYKFISSEQLYDVADSISHRLGLNESLTFSNISILYDMCRFDTAWNYQTVSSSPWCNVFSNADLQVLEYTEDLQNYWKDGYGYPLNYEQACPVLKDLITNFQNVIKHGEDTSAQEKPPVGLFHFSHSGMLMKFYARLGLFKDQTPPLATNFYSQSNRKWRSSEIDPFAGNIAFILFKCTAGNTPEYKVATYVQEKEVILQNCTTTLCPFDTFVATYGDLADTCNLAELCNTNGSNSIMVSIAMMLLSLLIVIRTAFM